MTTRKIGSISNGMHLRRLRSKEPTGTTLGRYLLGCHQPWTKDVEVLYVKPGPIPRCDAGLIWRLVPVYMQLGSLGNRGAEFPGKEDCRINGLPNEGILGSMYS